MLVLTRKPNQSLEFSDGTTITVLAVSGRNVRIGIDGNPQNKVLRTEAVRRTPPPAGRKPKADQ